MCTSRNRDKLWWVLECYIRSSALKQHLPDEIIYMVKGRRRQGPWLWWLQQQKGPGKGGCCAKQDPRHQQRSAGKAERQANSEPPLCSPETEPASLGFCSHTQGRFSTLQVMSLFRTKRHRCRERTLPTPPAICDLPPLLLARSSTVGLPLWLRSACSAADLGLIPRLGRCRGEGKGYSLQYSVLENYMDCIVRGVSQSQT